MRKSVIAAALVVLGAAVGILWRTDDAEAKAKPKVRPFIGVFTPGQEPGLVNNTSGPGVAFATYDDGTKMLFVSFSVSGLSGAPTMSHVHEGAPGVNGGVVFPFTDGTATAPSQSFGPLTSAQTKSLKKGLFYVNVHTAAATTGELRAQLMPVAGVAYTAP